MYFNLAETLLVAISIVGLGRDIAICHLNSRTRTRNKDLTRKNNTPHVMNRKIYMVTISVPDLGKVYSNESVTVAHEQLQSVALANQEGQERGYERAITLTGMQWI